jgi:cytosine/adenosine deaminase-related metal-dependent hydrolase
MSHMLFVIWTQHVAEIPYENEWVVKTRNVDHGTVTHLNNIGVLGKNLLAAHSVWVNPREVHFLQMLPTPCPTCSINFMLFPVQSLGSSL